MAGNNTKVKVWFKGEKYEIDVRNVTGIEDRKFRLAVGYTVPMAFDMLETQGLMLEPLAGMVWLAKLRRGENVTYDDVLGTISYQDLLDAEDAQEEEKKAEIAPLVEAAEKKKAKAAGAAS